MLSDIEIAQQAKIKKITEVAASLDIAADEIELYGNYKAKISDELEKRLSKNKDGKLILVTAINPTPAGEGKSTTSVGLAEAMPKIGKKAMLCLREPSLGPVFGVKGGAAGGGYAQVIPMEDINLHFTGDFHAITAANNLLCAMIDNHIHQGNALDIDPRRIIFKRCLDMNDRALRNCIIGLGGPTNGMPREDHFIITVASEIMAILCLADDIDDLKERLGDYLRLQQKRKSPVCKRFTGSRFNGSSLKGCRKAEPCPDLRKHPVSYPRRSVCKHRSRLQLGSRNQTRSEDGRLRYHGSRFRF